MTAFKISGIGFGFETPCEVGASVYYGRFRVSENEFNALEDRHLFTFCEGERPEAKSGTLLAKSGDYSVYMTEKGRAKVSSRFDGRSYECTCFQSLTEPGGELYFSENGLKAAKTEAELFRLIELFSALLYFDAFILHGAVVELDGTAYIFSGDSGVGKSTQAELWRKYGGARVLNGDRVILRKKGGEWLACGLPFCGSSKVCEDFMLPVGGIIFLSKGGKNEVSVPSELYKIVKVMSQLSLSAGRKEDSGRLAQLLGNLSQSVKILDYDCSPDRAAVDTLKVYLGL